MSIGISDLHLLSEGKPPETEEVLKSMTLGRELWLNYISERYLQNYIAKGGGKLKILVGGKGTGKTHLLRVVLADAKELDYQTVYLSARQYRLSDLPRLYQEVARQIVGEHLVSGLCRQIAKQIDETTEYDGSSVFSPYIYDRFPTPKMADDEIQRQIAQFFRDTDLSSSFKAFGCRVAHNRMVNQSTANIEIACDWLKGLPADHEASRNRRDISLYGKLNRTNARDWLNSLILLCKLAGYKGLVIGIDDLEAIMEKDNGRYFYSKIQALDTCELVRQLIDDTEVLSGCLFLLSGRKDIIEDNNRSFRSYDALWARLQVGLADYSKFNPFADLVDIDKHLASEDRFLPKIFKHIQVLLANQENDFTPPSEYREKASDLQKIIIDAVCSKGGKV